MPNCNGWLFQYFKKNEKTLLFDQIKNELQSKIELLEEEYNCVNYDSGHLMPEQSSNDEGQISKRELKLVENEGTPVTVTGPYIVYMLRDEEIMEDWTIIKQSISKTT